MINVKKNLREMIRQSGLEYKELAARLDVSPQALSNWLCRGNSISVDHVERITAALGYRAIDALTYPAKYIDSADRLNECPLYHLNPELFKGISTKLTCNNNNERAHD